MQHPQRHRRQNRREPPELRTQICCILWAALSLGRPAGVQRQREPVKCGLLPGGALPALRSPALLASGCGTELLASAMWRTRLMRRPYRSVLDASHSDEHGDVKCDRDCNQRESAREEVCALVSTT